MAMTEPRPGTGYERSDVSFKGAVIVTLGVLVTTLGAMLLMYPFFHYLKEREEHAQPARTTLLATDPNALPPEPRLQASPVDELRLFREVEHRALDGYAWVDRSAGRVRIPIERAIELVVTRDALKREGTTR